MISGWSEKGKSSIIHIIDYSLGSEKCLIPIGTVRERVSWFGVILAFPKGRQVLCARKNPGPLQESSDMYFAEGSPVTIPGEPSRTHSRDAVISILDEIAGLPTRGSNEEEGGSFDGPPSFRDMAAFNFQPQHIVANPNTLFFKADTWKHREKLIQSVLPYVLGAVDVATLDRQARLRANEAKLKVRTDELVLKRQALLRVDNDLRAHFRTAQSFDLIDTQLTPDQTWTTGDYVIHLRGAQKTWRDDPKIPPVSSAAKKVRGEVSALHRSQERLLRDRDEFERRLKKLQNVTDSLREFRSSLDIQLDRTSPVGWLKHRLLQTGLCPLCQKTELAPDRFVPLIHATESLSRTVAAATRGGPVLTTEARKLEDEIDQIDQQLSQIESQIVDRENRSKELAGLGSRRDFINSFIGRLDADLITAEQSGFAELEKEVSNLQKEVDLLREQVAPEQIKQRLNKAVSIVSTKIGYYARLMGVGHGDQDWYIDVKNLSLVARGNGRTDHLWEIGSAANWMGYHVAALLALHEFFRTIDYSPVPRFIIFDQPSQAYFPEGVGRKRASKQAPKLPDRSDDMRRLQNLFLALSKAVEKTDKGLQIILLEHAEPSMWEGIPHFSMPDGIEWRENGALIPADWK